MSRQKCDIILFSLFRWDSPYSSISIAMAKEFAKSHRIFYLNHPYSVKDYFKELSEHPARRRDLKSGRVRIEKDPQQPELFFSVIPPLTLPVNFLPKGSIYNQVAKYNHRQIHKAVAQIIEQHNIKQYVYINCFDPFFAPTLPQTLGPALNIYQSVDDISQNPYTARHGVYLEEAAIANADLTLVTSRELYRLKSPFTDQIEILNNAADIAIFKKALDIDYPKPDVIKDIKGKIIGFIGNLDAIRVNYPLIQKTAVAHPEKTIVLVGPINNEIYREIGLDQMPNVIFTGGMPIEALPPYLRYFDCTIIPFHCNTLTKSIYPLKINEYLAAGKAVVATNFSPDIEGFKSQLFLANDEEEFVQLIDPAIAAHSETAIANRIATAKTNTWKARIEQFWDFVNPRLPQHVAPQRHEPLVSLVESTTKEIRS